jgi:hypothetical protein
MSGSTAVSCPISTPTLKPPSDIAIAADGRLRPANPIGIDISKQPIGQRESVRDLLVAAGRKGNDVVGAIAMDVYELTRWRDRTHEPIAPKGQRGDHVTLDDAAMSLDFAPSDPAVVIAVDA